MKKGSTFLGIDDARHNREKDRDTELVGAAYRGTKYLEDLRIGKIEVDGKDSTEEIIRLYRKTESSHVKTILLDGISFAGMNIPDLGEIHEKTSTPVMAVTDTHPDRERFRKAAEKAGSMENFEKTSPPHRLEVEEKPVYIHSRGMEREMEKEVMKTSVLNGRIPECIRVADLLGKRL